MHQPESLLSMSVVVAVVVGGALLSRPAIAQTDSAKTSLESQFDGGPDVSNEAIRETISIRENREQKRQTDSILPEDIEPLHKFWDPRAKELRGYGLDLSLRYVFTYQHSSSLIPDYEQKYPGAQNDLSSGDIDIFAKWNVHKPGDPWAGYVKLSLEGRQAFTNVPVSYVGPVSGSIWPTVQGFNSQKFSFVELYWHQGTSKSPVEYRIGRIKNRGIWNGGRFIDPNSGIVGGQLASTRPYLPQAGWSANVAVQFDEGDTYVMGGVFQANGSNEIWNPIRWDQLVYAMQLVCNPRFGANPGRYQVFVWHQDETSRDSKVNGIALHVEQGLGEHGRWVPFLRYMLGDQNREDPKSRDVRQSVNIGLGYEHPFGRSKDWIALAATWAEPTNRNLRNQKSLELDYAFCLAPSVYLTPHGQVIFDPSENPGEDVLTIFGVRTRIVF